MKRFFAIGLALCLAISATTVLGELDMTWEEKDGRITGTATVQVAPQWEPSAVDDYIFDMPVPETFPTFNICTVQPMPVNIKLGKQALAGLIHENSTGNTWVFGGMDFNHELFTFHRKQEPNLDGYRAGNGKRARPEENHPQIVQMRQAEAVVCEALDRLGVGYEKPLSDVERAKDEVARFVRDGSPVGNTPEERAAYADMLLSRYPMPDMTLISTRLVYGGLPATMEASVPDSAYQGNDPNQPAQPSGSAYFGVDDEGKIVFANLWGIHRVKSETPFTGEIIPWDQAVKAVMMRDPNFYLGEGKAFWEKCYGKSYSSDGVRTVLSVTPACYVRGKQTVPAWCVTIRLDYTFSDEAHHIYDRYVDAVTGEYLHAI